MEKKPAGLSFELTPEQLKQLQPIIDASGTIKIAGTVDGRHFKVSFIACNAAFIACNAAFRVGSGSSQI
jgi:hypothetical protein